MRKRNNSLKSKLLHEQLKYGTYSFNSFKKEMLSVLNEYKIHKSILKSASIVGVDGFEAINWYVQGQNGDSQFKPFYSVINRINQADKKLIFDDEPHDVVTESDGCGEINDVYKISQYGDGWSYTTYIDGEKIFIISNELERLKEKVRLNNLPLN